MRKLLDFTHFLSKYDLSGRQIEIFNGIIVVLILLAASILAFYITRLLISKLLYYYFIKSRNDYDDLLIKNRVFIPLAHIIPAFIFFWGIKSITTDINLIDFSKHILISYLLIAFMIILFRGLNTFNDFYDIIAVKKNLSIHIKQYIQVLKIILIIALGILLISILFNKKPGALLAGLGAMTAIILLIFKDSIMSLVASIQISAYDLLKVGDWITLPSKEIDGDVMDISLNTIKIRNFDKTISSLPTYMVVQETFINWRGMLQTGGRRIKRSINIDVNTIKLCDEEMINKFKKIRLISEFVNEKNAEIKSWNTARLIHEPVEINGRGITNIGIFRKYIENYLRSNLNVYKKYHKEKFIINGKTTEFFVIEDKEEFLKDLDYKAKSLLGTVQEKTILKEVDKFVLLYSDKYILQNDYLYKINKIEEEVIINGVQVNKERFEKIVDKPGYFCDDLTLLVRQRPPTDEGIPIEIYVFSALTEWDKYEEIQADLFDHIFAIVPYFELKIYQQPASTDFQNLNNRIAQQ